MTNIEELTTSIPMHPAVRNTFYEQWEGRRFTIDELRLFVRNYGAFVEAFPAALAALIINTSDVEARTEYAKTLFSEMGYGHAAKAHSNLFYGFFNELALKLGERGQLERSLLVERNNLLSTSVAFIDGEHRLYSSPDPAVAVGAQLALEWQAYTMLRRLYEGARNYKDLWEDQDSFHEACEYFYAHIGEAEKEHKIESLQAARKYAVDDRSLEAIREGFGEHLDLIADFWNGLASQIGRGA